MTSQTKILVVDDEESIRFSLEETLTRDGYEVVTAESGEGALKLIDEQVFDLALIDLQLPGIKGMEILTTLRKKAPETAVIVLTAHATLETAVEALRHGAHDYLFKPCKTIELRQSIRQGLINRQKQLQQRDLLYQLEQHLATSLDNIRTTITNQTPHPPSFDVEPSPAVLPDIDDFSEKEGRFLQRNGLIVDFLRHIITLDNQLLELSPTEFNLLAYLISEAPRVVPAQELAQAVQGYASEQWEASETVRYHIYRLRQKIKAATNHADIIRTVRGVGYTIAD